MSGYKIVIPGRFTNKDLPVLGDDPVLNKGSLLLVEPGHSASLYSGDLADGDRLDNLAWREAQAMAGGTEASLKPRFERGSNAKVWRTGKGGIQWVGGGADADRVGAHFPLPVLEYLRANPKHLYRAIWWGGMVTENGVNGRWASVSFDLAQAVSSVYFDMTGGAAGGVDAAGNSLPNTNTATGPRRNHVGSGSNGYTGPLDATVAQADVWSRIFGNINPNRAPGAGQAIFHRFYLEDITVSGRSSTELDALDKDLYIKHELKAGGRYYGESWSVR